MNHEKYLQDNSEEALQMRQKVKDLFYSEEDTNFELACQLIKSGGMHQDFVPILWALAIKNSNKRKHNKIEKLVKQALTPDAFQIFKIWTVRFLDTYIHQFSSWEDWADGCLASICENPELASQQSEFAIVFISILRMGGRFSFHNALLPVDLILRLLYDTAYNGISLRNFRLTALPAELMNMANLEELYLQGNNLVEIPDVLVNLPLKSIKIEDDLPTHVIEKLERAYPKAMAIFHKSSGVTLAGSSQSLHRKGAMEESIRKAEKALDMLHRVSEELKNAQYWFSVGLAAINLRQYLFSIEANEKSISIDPFFGEGIGFYNLACAYAHLREKEKMIANLQQAAQHNSYVDWYKEALVDNDFTVYLEDEDFLKLVSK